MLFFRFKAAAILPIFLIHCTPNLVYAVDQHLSLPVPPNASTPSIAVPFYHEVKHRIPKARYSPPSIVLYRKTSQTRSRHSLAILNRDTSGLSVISSVAYGATNWIAVRFEIFVLSLTSSALFLAQYTSHVAVFSRFIIVHQMFCSPSSILISSNASASVSSHTIPH